MLDELTPGSTGNSIYVFLQDTAGAAKTGMAYNSAGLKIYYTRLRAASVAISPASQTPSGAWTSGGFCEVDANAPGLYRLDVPDAAVAVGVDMVSISFSGVSGLNPRHAGYTLRGRPGEIRCNKAQAGSAGSITLDTNASATDNLYRFSIVTIVAGTGVGQSRYIQSYVGSTKVATVTPNFVASPDSTSVFSISPDGKDLATVAQLVAAMLDEPTANHLTPGTIGASLAGGLGTTGLAQAGGSTTIQLAASSSLLDNFYKDDLVAIVAGTGAGQSPRLITSYTGSTRTATVGKPWITNPDATSVYCLIPNSDHPLALASINAILDGDITKPAAALDTSSWTLRNGMGWLMALSLWKIMQTNNQQTLRNENDTLDVATSALSDDGTTNIRDKFV